MQLQVMTSEHLRHLVAMETDDESSLLVDTAADVDDKLTELMQFHRISAVSKLLIATTFYSSVHHLKQFYLNMHSYPSILL